MKFSSEDYSITCKNLDSFMFEHLTNLVKHWGIHQIFMEKQGFHSVASARVVRFGIFNNFNSLFNISKIINVNMANPFSVPENRNHLTLFLNVPENYK